MLHNHNTIAYSIQMFRYLDCCHSFWSLKNTTELQSVLYLFTLTGNVYMCFKIDTISRMQNFCFKESLRKVMDFLLWLCCDHLLFIRILAIKFTRKKDRMSKKLNIYFIILKFLPGELKKIRKILTTDYTMV